MPSTSLTTACGEGTDEVHELVGRARLDPSISNLASRDVAAASAVWAQGQRDPELTDPHMVDQAAGEVSCGDGYLYETLVPRQPPTMPATDLYSSAQFDTAQQQVSSGLVYGSAVDVHGATVQWRSTCSSRRRPRQPLIRW